MTAGITRFEGASRLEADLRHYRELFEGAPDGYALTDAYGVILEGNRTLATMLDVHSRFLDRKLLVSFVARGDVRRFQASLSRILRGEGEGEIVSVSLRPRHGRAPFVAELAPRVVGGAGDRASSIATSIAKSIATSVRWGVRRSSSWAAQARASEDRSASGGEIGASAARDLRSLLRTVHAAGAALERELASGSVEARALLGEIQRASARMLLLTEDALDSSSLDGEKRGEP